MFGNKDIGMHDGLPWARMPRDTGTRTELCILTDHYDEHRHLAECGQPESAPVHRKSYAAGGHEFISEAMAGALDEAERDAEAAYDAAMAEHGF